MNPLKILISNDDGVFAEGIRTLASKASKTGHEVFVVCPDQEKSATGHGLTLHTPIRAERADELFAHGVTAWCCNGTPADCVKLALNELLGQARLTMHQRPASPMQPMRRPPQLKAKAKKTVKVKAKAARSTRISLRRRGPGM